MSSAGPLQCSLWSWRRSFLSPCTWLLALRPSALNILHTLSARHPDHLACKIQGSFNNTQKHPQRSETRALFKVFPEQLISSSGRIRQFSIYAPKTTTFFQMYRVGLMFKSTVELDTCLTRLRAHLKTSSISSRDANCSFSLGSSSLHFSATWSCHWAHGRSIVDHSGTGRLRQQHRSAVWVCFESVSTFHLQRSQHFRHVSGPQFPATSFKIKPKPCKLIQTQHIIR